jgi:hypothetical protein
MSHPYVIKCYDGTCKPVFVGARTAGEIIDPRTGAYVTGAQLVRPENVGIDMRGLAERAAARSRERHLQHTDDILDKILRG